MEKNKRTIKGKNEKSFFSLMNRTLMIIIIVTILILIIIIIIQTESYSDTRTFLLELFLFSCCVVLRPIGGALVRKRCLKHWHRFNVLKFNLVVPVFTLFVFFLF